MFKGSSIRIFAAGLLATTVVGSAIADMVYDDDKTMSAAPTKVEVKNIINANGPDAPAPVAIAPAAVTPAVIAESQPMQKASVKSKEKRGFQESVNNELVIQKLEDKRLKQEEKLTAEINKKFTLEDDAPAVAAGTAAPVLKEEVIVKPVADANNSSYDMSTAPKAEVATVKPIVQDQVATYQSSTSMTVAPAAVNTSTAVPSGKPEGEKSSKAGVSISPRAGFSTISNDFYDITSKGSAGVGLGFDVSDNVGIELGYMYSSYDVALKGAMNYGGYQPNQLVFKNNTFDISMKLYLAGLDAKVRPFVGGGMAYSVGYINYNQSQGYYNYYQTSDYQLSQYSGIVKAGIDFKIAANVSLGVTYQFIKPFSSTESQDGLYNSGFYGAGYSSYDPSKQALRGSLKESNTQMVLVGASVTF